jgi:hypothetical protein
MADTQDASDAGRELARARWGNAAVTRAAEVVIGRAAELDDVTLARLRQVTEHGADAPAPREAADSG